VYIVRVYDRQKGRTAQPVEERSFPFGQWQEIGWWLNDSGLTEPQYRVSIYFTEES